MSAHLLTLADLHAAAPGVLSVIFGRDGTFGNAPDFTGPVYGPADGYSPGWWHVEGFDDDDVLLMNDALGRRENLSLDCRVPAIAARLAGLCAKASDGGYTLSDTRVIHAGLTAPRFGITEEEAGDVAGLTLSYAKAIAALKDAP